MDKQVSDAHRRFHFLLKVTQKPNNTESFSKTLSILPHEQEYFYLMITNKGIRYANSGIAKERLYVIETDFTADSLIEIGWMTQNGY